MKNAVRFGTRVAVLAFIYAAKPEAAMAAWSFPYEETVDGVTWKFAINFLESGDSYAGVGTNSTSAYHYSNDVAVENAPESLKVPASFTANEIEYEVRQVNTCAFYNLSGLKHVTLPGCCYLVNHWAFRGSGLESIWFQSGTADPLRQPSNGIRAPFYSCPELKCVLVGSGTKCNTSYPISFTSGSGINGCTFFLPNLDSWRTFTNAWTDVSAGTHKYAGDNPDFVLYGAGEDLDLQIDETLMTATFVPANAAGLRKSLSHAPAFRKNFGLDAKIRLAGEYDTTATLSEAELGLVSFASEPWVWTTISVQTQAQLETALSAFDPGMALVLDITDATEEITVITDATEEITVPANRRIAVCCAGETTYGQAQARHGDHHQVS